VDATKHGCGNFPICDGSSAAAYEPFRDATGKIALFRTEGG